MDSQYHEVELCGEGSFLYVHCQDLMLTPQERQLYICWIMEIWG